MLTTPHSPAFALKKIKCPAVTRKNEKGAEIVMEPERELEGRGLGAMISNSYKSGARTR